MKEPRGSSWIHKGRSIKKDEVGHEVRDFKK